MPSTPMAVASFDDWWRIVPSLAGPVAGLLASLPDEMTSAIRDNAQAALQPFATASGYAIPGLSLIGAGSP